MKKKNYETYTLCGLFFATVSWFSSSGIWRSCFESLTSYWQSKCHFKDHTRLFLCMFWPIYYKKYAYSLHYWELAFNMCCGILDFWMYLSFFLGSYLFLFIQLYENHYAETWNFFKLDNPSTLCLCLLFSKSLEHCLVMLLKVQDDLKNLCCIARRQWSNSIKKMKTLLFALEKSWQLCRIFYSY